MKEELYSISNSCVYRLVYFLSKDRTTFVPLLSNSYAQSSRLFFLRIMASHEAKSKTTYTHDVVNKVKYNQLCKVCECENASMSYGVLCCSPCKIFFRRNAQSDRVRQNMKLQ